MYEKGFLLHYENLYLKLKWCSHLTLKQNILSFKFLAAMRFIHLIYICSILYYTNHENILKKLLL